MKLGRSLQELAVEIDRQRNAKHDYLADTRNIDLRVEREEGDKAFVRLALGEVDESSTKRFNIMPLMHDQIAGHVGIPAAYYKRMQAEAPDLLVNNVNHWFKQNPTQRMVRTLDGAARAFLSNSYRPLDNDALVEAVIPPLMELGVEVMSSEITPTRLYIKAVDSRINKDIPTGRMGDGSHTIFDTVCPAIIITNSEVGLGALSVQTAVWTKACTNMAVFAERSARKYHVGQRADIGEEIYALLSDQTRRITDAALWAQIGDVVRGAFDRAKFDALADKLAAAAGDEIKADPVKVVELTAKRYQFTSGETSSVLQHLIRGGNMTRYGLSAAITRAAEDEDNYDYATQMERIGGRVIELERNEWAELLQAA